MKIGVDGVLIGCWTNIDKSCRILDVGTGCGLIALIMAQRAPDSEIVAVDIDPPSIEEATENVNSSPWSDRIAVRNSSFYDVTQSISGKFDLIVSNPPYFDSGVSKTVTAREKARHQGELSPSSLLEGALRILSPGGSVAMVIPAEYTGSLESEASSLGYTLSRKCLVRGHEDAPYKRALLQWHLGCDRVEPHNELSLLTLENPRSVPTAEYRALCKDFYLKF